MNAPSHSIIDSIDSKVDVPVEKDEMVEKAVNKYPLHFGDFTKLNSTVEKLKSQVPLLAPSQIDLVLQRLLQTHYEDGSDISLYISVLIQKSYDAGHNGFVLHTQNVPLSYLCSHIEGREGRLLSMTVHGDTDNVTGSGSKWCSLRQEGNAEDWYFQSAEHSKIFITGSLGYAPLTNSEGILFKTANKGAFDCVKNAVEKKESRISDCKLYLIDPAGNALSERRYPSEVVK